MRDRSVNVKCSSVGKRKREGAHYPGYYPSSMPLDIRLSRAAEYAAYQLRQINRKLDRLVEAAERIAESLTGSTRR
jgi:hypothetical protein